MWGRLSYTGHVALFSSCSPLIFTHADKTTELAATFIPVREGTFFLGGGGRAGEFWDFFPKKVLALPCVLMKTLLTPHL